MIETAGRIMPTILIVENETRAREGICRVLERRGYETRCASTVEEAIGEMERELPDLIVLDLTLAGGSGRGLLDFVRDFEGAGVFPVVAYASAPVNVEVSGIVKALGIRHVLTKQEVTGEGLVYCIQTHLGA